ncbi:MAG: 1-acyl-sn-glycerol-3-phosphate acyltransferase [Clostridiales Family XIII bacterium]|nr:1-acyl-sn-glycerol-3-phosphate acyltransferase [Clostridiales Family XIII bacterium]
MRILKNIPFILWMIGSLVSIRKFRKPIEVYREQGNHEKEREAIQKVIAYWGPKALKRFGVTVRAEGLARIPDGSVLFVSNHQGYGDIFVILGIITNKQFGFIAKESLRRVPIFGKWVGRIKSLFLSRNDARAALTVFRQGEEWLKDGFSLVIFPEGTRSRGEEMGHFKRGSLRLAVKTGVPVVPVSISGTWRLFEEKGYVRSGDVRFYIHPVIETKGLSKAEAADLADRIEGVIRGKLDEWNA